MEYLTPIRFPDGTTQVTAATTYDFAAFVSGKPTAGAVVFATEAVRPFSFAAALAGSRVSAGSAATASCVWSYRKNGVEFATATFAAGSSVTTLAGTATSFALTDLFQIVAPATQDATQANIRHSLLGALI